MKRTALFISIFLLCIPANVYSEITEKPADLTRKIIVTNWIGQSILKYGMLGSLCTAQALSGLVESHKYNGNHIVSDDNYHVYRTAQDISWIGTGWLLYANMRSKDISWWTKTRRVLGSACIARDCFELMYRANRTGDPFNYSDKYTSNKKAIVYFKWDGNKGKFVDLYISGTGKRGAFIDIGFFLLGWWLFPD